MAQAKNKTIKASKQTESVESVISFILSSTTHDQQDAAVRTNVNNAINRAIAMSKRRGGSVCKPKDTAIYKFAEAAATATSFKNLKKIAGDATKNIKTSQMKTAFGLNWTLGGKVVKTAPEDLRPVVQSLQKQVRILTKGILQLWKAFNKHTHQVGKATLKPKQNK